MVFWLQDNFITVGKWIILSFYSKNVNPSRSNVEIAPLLNVITAFYHGRAVKSIFGKVVIQVFGAVYFYKF